MILHRKLFWLCALVFFPFLSTFLLAQQKPPIVSYNLNVTIDPWMETILVRGDVAVPFSEAGARTVQFALHETFEIKQMSVDGRKSKFSSHRAVPTMLHPARQMVTVNLPSATPAETVHVQLEYVGTLKQIPEFGTTENQKVALDDQINPRLVELANYSSWYPQFFDFGRPIEVHLEVSLPDGWMAICSGRKIEDRVRDGRAVTRWSSLKDTDILITAAPNYKRKVVSGAQGEVEIYSTRLPDEFIAREGGEILAVMNLFSEGLGEPTIASSSIKHVFSPKHKGQGRAGIARTGMIVTSEGRVLEELAKNPKYSLFQDVAHEIGHFWWNFGAGQGDWINESFAEYSSAIAVEKILSEEQFRKVLEGYRTAVATLSADAPSLATVPADGSGFVVRYYKGSLMLHAIREALGDDAFFQAARAFFDSYRDGSIGTVEFRSFWKARLGDRKELVDQWLDSSGGLPEAGIHAFRQNFHSL